MKLIDIIRSDLLEARKSRDNLKSFVLRSIISEAEINFENSGSFTNRDVGIVVEKEIRLIKKMLRTNITQEELEENKQIVKLLEGYLPKYLQIPDVYRVVDKSGALCELTVSSALAKSKEYFIRENKYNNAMFPDDIAIEIIQKSFAQGKALNRK